MGDFFADVGTAIESGVRGVLSLPNRLRDLSDELGTQIFGRLEQAGEEFEQIARPEAEEFFSSQAGAQAGRTAFRLRGLGPLATIIIAILVLVLILR